MAGIKTLRNRFAEQETAYVKRKAEHDILLGQITDEHEKFEDKRALKEQYDSVIAILNRAAETAREAGRQRMEKVVTRALQSVFGPDFSFEIELTESGGKPVANFYVVSDQGNGTIVKNEPQNSRGGGINDIVAFALQVAVLVVYNSPKIQGPIILDEPGKHVSEDYVVKFGEFLDFISKTFNRQIFMVTHQPHLAQTADKTMISQLVGGKTVIKEYDGDGESEDQWESGSDELQESDWN